MYTREEVMTYIDKYGRYHDKPCINGEPKSNNGWIYTAYAKNLGLGINRTQIKDCFTRCNIYDFKKQTHHIIRSPNKHLPPMSRDEVLGLAALRLLTPASVKHNNWSFSPYPIPKFNLIKLVKQLLEMKGKHRNYFWENNLDQVYRFAFSVPLVDRHFILQQWGKFNLFYWAIAKLDSMSSSESGIRWLKYGKSLEAMQEEFPEDHPFRLTN